MTKLDDFRAAERDSRYAASRLLFSWLSVDVERGDLYRCLIDDGEPLLFQSRADVKIRPTDPGNSTFQQDVYLLTKRTHIEQALTDTQNFSNAPYQVLGSGTFMLGLDGGDHVNQRNFAAAYLRNIGPAIPALSNLAFKAAAVLPLKQRRFDLAYLGEQAALRFMGFLFGFAQADHAVLEGAMQQAYRGLNYQIIGRHFISEPGAVERAAAAMGGLLTRVAYLIDLYREQVGREQADEYKRINDELEELRQWKDQKGTRPLANFKPVLRRIAEQKDFPPGYSGAELAVIVVGLISGAIHNVQASTAIAVNEFFRDPRVLKLATDEAVRSWQQNADYGATDELKALIWEALRLNPPAAFLPRRTKSRLTLGNTSIPSGSVVLLAMGGATRDKPGDPDVFRADRNDRDPLIFGGAPGVPHQCVGDHLAMPLVTHLVRQVLRLPGLDQCLDPRTGSPQRLEKLWGIICQKYPLEFTRQDILTQSPLIVIMNVRTPVPEHADALRKIIKYGAPRIEKKLRDAKHVHFAEFLLIENDSKLVLFTIYDRDFDSYIEHFALKIGPLFDKVFEHIQDAPPQPVDEFPKEFIDTIRRHNARPAGDYFFSAYPKTDVSMIINQFPREDG